MTIQERIAKATTKRELVEIARELQLAVPERVSVAVLKRVLQSVADARSVAEQVCKCSHLRRDHYIDNATGVAKACKTPDCNCTRFEGRA